MSVAGNSNTNSPSGNNNKFYQTPGMTETYYSTMQDVITECKTPDTICQINTCKNNGICRNEKFNAVCDCLNTPFGGKFCEKRGRLVKFEQYRNSQPLKYKFPKENTLGEYLTFVVSTKRQKFQDLIFIGNELKNELDYLVAMILVSTFLCFCVLCPIAYVTVTNLTQPNTTKK